MRIATTRFGEIDVDETSVLDFADGIPGFGGPRRFALLWTETEGWGWLQDVVNDDLAFPVIIPWVPFPEYEADLPDDDLDSIGISSPADLLVVSLVTVLGGDDGNTATANLFAPIVVNLDSGAARQVIIEHADKALLRQPLPALDIRDA